MVQSRTRVYGFVALAAVLVLAAFFLTDLFTSRSSASPGQQGSGRGTDGKGEQPEVIPVQAAAVMRGEISSRVSSTGTLRPLREVEVASRSDGIVKALFVEEGSFVQEGTELCLLDDSTLRIRLFSAQQKLAQARIQLEKAGLRLSKARIQINNAREDLERHQELFRQNLVSEREVSQLRYKLDELLQDERVSESETRELQHRLEELEAEISTAELELERTRVKAPFSGRITHRMVEVGQTVRNLEPLFRLADFSPLFVDIFLSEKEARQIRMGQAVQVLLGVDQNLSVGARVDRISPVIDQSSGTLKVTVRLDSAPAELRPGAFVRVEIQVERRADTLLIPRRALVETDGEVYVFRIQDQVAEKVPVRVGFREGDSVEVLSGLQEGEQVVTAGQGALKEKSPIRVVGETE